MNSGDERSQDADRAERLRSLAEPLIGAVRRVSALDQFWAKTCIYYAIATHGLYELPWFPILSLQGEYASGKSQLMKLIRHFVKDPVWMSTTPTPASLRDNLGNNSTAFIEEGDKVDEEVISNRYSRDTALANVKREYPSRGWMDTRVEFFGATVLHRRHGFKDPATASRALVIKTRHKEGDYASVEQMESELAALADRARQIWERCNFEIERGGRAEDVWRPLTIVAETLRDMEWLKQYSLEIEKQENRLRNGAGYEPDQLVVLALIGLYKGSMIPLKDMREWLRKEYGWEPSAWQLGDAVRSLGANVKTSHGQRKVETTKEWIVEKARELGIEDDALNSLGHVSIRGLK